MRLVTAHRILVGTFVIFSLFFAGLKLVGWRQSGASGELLMALLSLAAAIGFGLYWRTIGDLSGDSETDHEQS